MWNPVADSRDCDKSLTRSTQIESSPRASHSNPVISWCRAMIFGIGFCRWVHANHNFELRGLCELCVILDFQVSWSSPQLELINNQIKNFTQRNPWMALLRPRRSMLRTASIDHQMTIPKIFARDHDITDCCAEESSEIHKPDDCMPSGLRGEHDQDAIMTNPVRINEHDQVSDLFTASVAVSAVKTEAIAGSNDWHTNGQSSRPDLAFCVRMMSFWAAPFIFVSNF
jgi:hypothetical protein